MTENEASKIESGGGDGNKPGSVPVFPSYPPPNPTQNSSDKGALITLQLNKNKLLFGCGFIGIFLMYVFGAGLLPAILTGTIDSVHMTPRLKFAFFINSIVAFVFGPLLLFSALWRGGSMSFYSEYIVFHRVIGDKRNLKYSSMSVTQNARNLLICDSNKLEKANWIKTIWIEWLYGMYVPIDSLLINKDDQQNAINIQEECSNF